MSITIRSLALAALTCALPVAAQAGELMIFRFTGTVGESNLADVATGDTISGFMAYDPETLPVRRYGPGPKGGHLAFYEFDKGSAILGAWVGSHYFETDYLSGHVHDNMGGNIEDSFSIGGSSPSMDGVSMPGGSFSLVLASMPAHTEALHGTQLPVGFDVPAFDAYDGFFSSIRRNGEQDGFLMSFAVTAMAPIPEPGGGMLALLGMAALGTAVRRHRAR